MRQRCTQQTPRRPPSTRQRCFTDFPGCPHCSRIQICCCCDAGKSHRAGTLRESTSGAPMQC
eukprot:7190522-Prorocentrum_lima.AAC.1